MPTAEDDREVRIPFLDRPGNLHRLADHRPCYQRNSEAQGIFYFLHDALLVVRRNGSVNAGERGNEEYNLFRRFHGGCLSFLQNLLTKSYSLKRLEDRVRHSELKNY